MSCDNDCEPWNLQSLLLLANLNCSKTVFQFSDYVCEV